jgi:hypothetical protein
MLNRIVVYMAAGLLLAACQSTSNSVQVASAVELSENLREIKIKGLDTVHIAPDADLSNYTAVLLPPLDIDSVEIKQPSANHRIPGAKDWVLTDDDKASLQKAFRELMSEKLAADNGFVIADVAGENTLKLQVVLTTIAPTAPKDDFNSRPTGRSRIYSEGFGDVSIRIEITDSLSGQLLATAEDKKRGDTTWRLNNRITNWAEIRRMLRSWSVQIRNGLDEIKANSQAA